MQMMFYMNWNVECFGRYFDEHYSLVHYKVEYMSRDHNVRHCWRAIATFKLKSYCAVLGIRLAFISPRDLTAVGEMAATSKESSVNSVGGNDICR